MYGNLYIHNKLITSGGIYTFYTHFLQTTDHLQIYKFWLQQQWKYANIQLQIRLLHFKIKFHKDYCFLDVA
jgi:hypothetical protein